MNWNVSGNTIRVFLIASVCALFLPGAVAFPAESPLGPAFDAYVSNMLKTWGAPGVMISVVKDGKPLFCKGYGTRRLGADLPIDGDTLVPIASNSKAFTAAAIAMLVDEGRLSWDDPVKKYIPEFQLLDQYAAEHATLRDVLSHRAGLAAYLTTQNDLEHTRADVIRGIRFQDPTTGFRENFFYSNIGYLLAGEIVARVSGMSWEEFVTRRILQPLGMTSSFSNIVDLRKRGNPDDMPNIFIPHRRNADGSVDVVSWSERCNLYAAAGGVTTTGNDIAKWMLLQLGEGEYQGKRLISAARVREMHSPQMVMDISWAETVYNPLAHSVSYDMGWTSHDYRGRRVDEHLGSFMNAVIAVVPEEKLGVTVCTNAAFDNFESLRMISALKLKVIDACIGAPDTDWSAVYREIQRKAPAASAPAPAPSAGTPALPLANYTGDYSDPVRGLVNVALESGRLVLRYRPGYLGDLTPSGGNVFRVNWRGEPGVTSEVRFDPSGGKRGKVLVWKGFGTFGVK